MRLTYSPVWLALLLFGCPQKTEAPVTRAKMRCAVPLPGSWKPAVATTPEHLFEAVPQTPPGSLVVTASTQKEAGGAIAQEAQRSATLHGTQRDFTVLPPSPLAKGMLHVSQWRSGEGAPLRSRVAFASEQQGQLVVAVFEDIDEAEVSTLVGALTSMSCAVAP